MIIGVKYQTLWRYKRRIDSAKEVIGKRGPKVAPPVDPYQLRNDIRKLKHCNKRTYGTEELYMKYRNFVTRERFDEMVREVREDLKKGRRDYIEHISWDCPHMVWAMDDFEYTDKGVKHYVHQVQDLASRNKFEPLDSTEPVKGEEVAANLQKLFKKYGAPLFMKRDNGSNLNHSKVRDTLETFGVIPMNNPAYYPQFNGGVERAQGEVKKELDRLTEQFERPDTFPFAVKQAIHNVNHNPRPVSLKGNCSCGVWMLHMGVRFSKRYRSEVYQQIKELALDIAEKINYSYRELVVSECWRKAVKEWLIAKGHITATRKKKCNPIF